MTDEEKKAQEAAVEPSAQPVIEQKNDGKDPSEVVQAKDGNGVPVTEKMPRDVFFERIRTNVPDGKYDDDEQEYFRHAISLLDKAEVGSKKFEQMTEKLMRRYQDDPEEVAILMDYMEGMPLIEAIIKHKGEEALTMKEGDEGYEGYKKAIEVRKADRQKYIDLMNEVDGNMQATVTDFNEWANELNLDDEQRAELWKVMQSDLDNMSRGKFSKDIYNRYRTALNHDNDIDGAYQQGKADAKNEQIEVKHKQMKGSGLPNGNGGGSTRTETEKPTDSTANWLAGMIHR